MGNGNQQQNYQPIEEARQVPCIWRQQAKQIISTPEADRVPPAHDPLSATKIAQPQLRVKSLSITEAGYTIAPSLNVNDISLHNAERFFVDHTEVSEEKIKRVIAETASGIHVFRLQNNKFFVDYRMEFQHPQESHLTSVEKVFEEIFYSGGLGAEKIGEFITESKKSNGEPGYVEGVSSYLYGVLAKDQCGGTGLAQSDYKAKFNLAREALGLLNRPLANLIKALVNFNDNAFSEAEALAPDGQVAIACRMLSGLRSGKYYQASAVKIAPTSHNLPVDTLTAEIMRFCSLPLAEQQEQLPQLVHLSSKRLTTGHDRVKIQALAMNTCWEAGDVEQAASWAKKLRHSPLFETLATRIIEDVKQ